MARVKFNKEKIVLETRAKFKKTSIGSKPSKTMMNKQKRKSYKKNVGQGKR